MFVTTGNQKLVDVLVTHRDHWAGLSPVCDNKNHETRPGGEAKAQDTMLTCPPEKNTHCSDKNQKTFLIWLSKGN